MQRIKLKNTLLAFITLALHFAFLSSCDQNNVDSISVKKTVNGKTVEDTATYKTPEFSFINQYGDSITHADVLGNVFVVDFFFINCPSICPKMKAQLLRVHEKFKHRSDFIILSHTIDPKRDTVFALKSYANKLGVENGWWLLTGNKEELFKAADAYLISAEADPESPGGFAHSGNFMLVDKDGKLRGYYDGTNETATNKLMDDIEKLLRFYDNQ